MQRSVALTLIFASLGCVTPAATPPMRSPARTPRYRASLPPPAEAAAESIPEEPAEPTPPDRPGGYALHQLPMLSKVLFYTRENYYDPQRFDFQAMMLAAVDFMQR